MVDCVTDYINFCVDNTIPTKDLHCFPNNKPWITSDLKALLNDKKRHFRREDKEEVKRVQRELKQKLRESKEAYRRKVEDKLQRNRVRDVRSSMREITGFKQAGGATEGNLEMTNELNQFFNRFDSGPSVAHHPSPHSHTIALTARENLPFSVENKWRLLGMMVVFFGSGFTFPFIVVRHQLLKK
ncbi:COX7C oxidase, partial [Atractosteus spatula]|nr:COX7C oxidase [Atractosteus spatula]